MLSVQYVQDPPCWQLYIPDITQHRHTTGGRRRMRRSTHDEEQGEQPARQESSGQVRRRLGTAGQCKGKLNQTVRRGQYYVEHARHDDNPSGKEQEHAKLHLHADTWLIR
jgi:hypothetical protein